MPAAPPGRGVPEIPAQYRQGRASVAQCRSGFVDEHQPFQHVDHVRLARFNPCRSATSATSATSGRRISLASRVSFMAEAKPVQPCADRPAMHRHAMHGGHPGHDLVQRQTALTDRRSRSQSAQGASLPSAWLPCAFGKSPRSRVYICHQSLKFGVLALKWLQPLGIGQVHRAVLGLQLEKGRWDQTMLPAQLCRRKPSLLLLDHPDSLRFDETAFPRVVCSFSGRLYIRMRQLPGGRSGGRCSRSASDLGGERLGRPDA